jgi:hypothetical protein
MICQGDPQCKTDQIPVAVAMVAQGKEWLACDSCATVVTSRYDRLGLDYKTFPIRSESVTPRR